MAPTFPDLVSLDLFATTVRLGSISAAASAHAMSQPSVSTRIRSLEHRLGLQLLARSASGSKPTSDGSVVAEWTEVLLASADELASAVVAELGSTAAVREAVAAGLGPAALSELAVRAELAIGRLVSVRVSGVDLARRFRAVWGETGEPPPRIRELVAVARSGV